MTPNNFICFILSQILSHPAAGLALLKIIKILLYLLPSTEVRGVHHHAWPLRLVLLSRSYSKQPYLTQAMHEVPIFFPSSFVVWGLTLKFSKSPQNTVFLDICMEDH